MANRLFILLVVLVVLTVILPNHQVCAFGAGNIPGFGYLEGKAFRHGDIEDVLAELMKSAGTGFLNRGSKFNGLDIKRVYFGNWLRDYSQAVDIAGLKKVPLQTIMNLVMVLGFMANGYATNEFEVTEERLGVYLPTEHIDNPKGYGEGEDPRKYHPKLRPPVDPIELEVDLRTGIKNYIANEQGHWDTSKALVRRTLEKCIHLGRQHRGSGRKEDLYESFRLLGQSMHTLEDFAAHSNFCELALVSLGYNQVFCHVGDHVRIQAPNGKMVAPLVTGTFGGSDFMHSLLGEATDHISEASVSDLSKQLDNARSASNAGQGSAVRELMFQMPGGGDSELSREMDGVESIRAGQSMGGKRPEDMSPQELHATLWQILKFRDSVMKKIEKTIERIPGLSSLVDKLTSGISVFVLTTLEPFLKPLMKTATGALQSSSAEVVNSHDQFEVFNDPIASDPTHSFLSKDHFGLILNEPAGHLAMIIVRHTVSLVTRAWDDNSVDVRSITEDILQCLFHPDFHNSNSKIQREMMHYMQTWINNEGHQKYNVLERLSKEAVRNHKNTRIKADESEAHVGGVGHNLGLEAQSAVGGYVHQIPGVAQVQNAMGMFSRITTGTGRELSPGVTVASEQTTSSGPGGYYSSSTTLVTQQGSAPSFPGSPPTFPGSPTQFPSAPGAYGGSSPPPSQPSYSSMPDIPNQGGYSNPGYQSYAPPPGPPPSFPSPGEYGPPAGQPPYYGGTQGPYGAPQPPYGAAQPPYGAPQPPYGPPGPPQFPGSPEYGSQGAYNNQYGGGYGGQW